MSKFGATPACFSHQDQWDAWSKLNNESRDRDTEDLAHFCDDCTAGYKFRMIMAARCASADNMDGRNLRLGLTLRREDMTTPEGVVKQSVKDRLKLWTDTHGYQLYTHWPVLTGYGSPELDMNGVWRGRPFSIETKAPGEKPTKRQWLTIADKVAAMVPVLVFSGTPEDHQDLGNLLWALHEDNIYIALGISDQNLERYRG